MSSQRGSFAEVSIRSKIDKAHRASSIGGNSSRTSLPLSPSADMVNRVRTPSNAPSPSKPPRASRNASVVLPTINPPTSLQTADLLNSSDNQHPSSEAPSPVSQRSMAVTPVLKRITLTSHNN